MSFNTTEDAAALRRDARSAMTGAARLRQALDLSQLVLNLSAAGAATRRVTEPGADRGASALHFGIRLIGPFVKGASVARCPVVTQDLQDERRETRPRTAPSIGKDRGLRCDPLGRQECGELGGRLQRPMVGIEKLFVF